MTVRTAQGASLDGVVCYSEVSKLLERGFAYVALSRTRRSEGCFHFGRIRRTDWLPAVGDRAEEHTERSVLAGLSAEEDADRSSCSANAVCYALGEASRGSLGMTHVEQGGSSSEEDAFCDGVSLDAAELGDIWQRKSSAGIVLRI